MRSIYQLSRLMIIVMLLQASSVIADDKVKNSEYVKFMQYPKIKSLKLIEEGLNKINENCCEENFFKKRKVFEIKNNLEKCIANKCYEKHTLIFAKPPLKAIAINQLSLIDDLLIENDKIKYENIKSKNANDELKLKKLQNEKDIQLLKAKLEKITKENIKLKKTVDKMLSKYQQKIMKLEAENKELENAFSTTYDMLSKRNKKKVDELLSN